MQEENREKNLWELVDNYKGDVVIRCKVYEDHNCEEFKKMNKRFKNKLGRISHEPRYRELMEYYEAIKKEFN